MKAFWDNRYGLENYAYGKAPNEFFRAQIQCFQQGDTIIFPAEGEGRNAVFAAETGMLAKAFDQSVEGKRKAEKLAADRGCAIEYQVVDGGSADYPANSADGAVFIYAHFDEATRKEVHLQAANWLKEKGLIIFEAFSKNHLAYQAQYPGVGGPKELSMLVSKEDILAEFPNFHVLYLEEEIIELNEGDCHCGKGSVIRFIGEKKA